MARRTYELTSTWRLQADPDEVYEVLLRADDYPRWWPAVFTDSLLIQSGDEAGEAKVVRLEGRGCLPLLLRWHVVVGDVERPLLLNRRFWGDIEGEDSWTISPDRGGVEAVYVCRLQVKTSLLKTLLPALRPLLKASFRWAMSQGERSIELEMMRRRAVSEAEKTAIPLPPQGIARARRSLALGIGALIALVVVKGSRGR